ncbi:hypothetical protein [Magnetovibrio blakemorei]|uniref:Uncharacterized protein n=1 Tax=Magnetovibrio blakemorei TaxID=28181 RepID=A0A1E5QBW3_9PROT|nr:hypothetical protein [Magnetovibrio blakemorei]OEJ69561.1 hypothetical protein BEN30_02470 [Magnetovibrio blakemorei]
MSHTYRYTEKDLLAGEAYHYHYAQYEGEALLQGYAEDRARVLATLEHKLAQGGYEKGGDVNVVQALAAWPVPLRDAGNAPFRGIFDRPVNTANELSAAVAWVACGGDYQNDTLVRLVDVLVKKFEVSKRLRSRYAPGVRLDVRDSAPLGAYCCLAFLIALCPESSAQLWRLNALLKINDLVVSADWSSLDAYSYAAFLAALRIERDMVNALLKDKRLEAL